MPGVRGAIEQALRRCHKPILLIDRGDVCPDFFRGDVDEDELTVLRTIEKKFPVGRNALILSLQFDRTRPGRSQRKLFPSGRIPERDLT